MDFDLQRARSETPGCENVIHFNNAGAALMPQTVFDAVVEYLQLEAQIGGYEAAETKRADVERVYSAIAKMISCRPSEIAIIENATRAWDMAFYSLDFQAGDRILTARVELIEEDGDQISLNRESDNRFVLGGGYPLNGPQDLLVTDIFGQEVTLDDVNITGGADTEQVTGEQFGLI